MNPSYQKTTQSNKRHECLRGSAITVTHGQNPTNRKVLEPLAGLGETFITLGKITWTRQKLTVFVAWSVTVMKPSFCWKANSTH